MRYEEFKKELYRNVVLSDYAKDKQIRLLEQRMMCVDAENIRIIKKINFDRYGFKSILLNDDILCAIWSEKGRKILKHWGVRDMHKSYLEEGWKAVLPRIEIQLQGYNQIHKGVCSGYSYEDSRDGHILRTVNYYHHKEELENCLYWTIGDIALVLYDVIGNEADDVPAVKVKHDTADLWGLSNHAILSAALMNTRTKMPPRFFRCDDLGYRSKSEEGIFMPDDGEITVNIDMHNKREKSRGYRLTTVKWFYGAIALFYPQVKEQIARMMGGDFYVGFTSIDEAMIYPIQNNVAMELRQKVRYNNAMLDERRILSNSIYRYCSARHELLEV